MTAATGVQFLNAPTVPGVPGIGDIVYLCSCVMQVGSEAVTTPPDVPNQYGADLKVMGDVGDMNLDAIRGGQGPAGQPMFALREQNDPTVSSPADLPTLTNDRKDIGKYWLLDELDDQGHVLTQWCYVWWGSFYRQIMMGVPGEPGAVPRVNPLITPIDPAETAYVKATGPSLVPTWNFMMPSPAGAPGAVGSLYGFPDVDVISTPPVGDDLLAFTGTYTAQGAPVWVPYNIAQLAPKTYSMPESAFTSYNGFSQQAPIGSFAIPPQPFPWTPIVWGHIGGAGVQLSGGNPFMIGCQVLLGNAVTGQQIARGLGNTLGEVNIMPHYSSLKSTKAAITPRTRTNVVPANHTGTAGTLYINLWNDGALGSYLFSPGNAQVFVMVLPMEEIT
jgi:hypothetical protein